MAARSLRRGEEVLLDIRDSARRRVLCGLRWDPSAGSGGGGSISTNAHDLDLLCLTFDKEGNFIEGITGDDGHRGGDNGNIYHTGDVVDGDDILDDEQISMELFNLSSTIHQIFFIAEIHSNHNFGDIHQPEIRIANAIDDVNFAHSILGLGDGADKDAYIFGCMYRAEDGWRFKQIGDYIDLADVTDWADTLKHDLIKDESSSKKSRRAMPKKGQTVTLRYTEQARWRVLCGLNWDPTPDEPTDLDLACVIYNDSGEAVDGVSAQPEETADQSGKIYHSGDDTSGEGNRIDDESISVELRGLPAYVQHIVFIAEVQSGQSLAEIKNPSMRIADGKSNETQLLTNLKQSEKADSCIFARISRKGELFTLTPIEDYVDAEEIDDWIEYLKRYLP